MNNWYLCFNPFWKAPVSTVVSQINQSMFSPKNNRLQISAQSAYSIWGMFYFYLLWLVLKSFTVLCKIQHFKVFFVWLCLYDQPFVTLIWQDLLSMPSMMQPLQRKTGRVFRELAEASSKMTQQKLGDLGLVSTLFIILQVTYATLPDWLILSCVLYCLLQYCLLIYVVSTSQYVSQSLFLNIYHII